MSNTLGIWSLRQEAEPIGELLASKLDGKHFRPWQNHELTPKEQFQLVYHDCDQWVLIMTTGIAVRFIDSLGCDKFTDPAIVVLDEGCHHAISLLGGHEGGANELAFKVANLVGAAPVVTTATECLKPLILGIGCRKGISVGKIEKCVLEALGSRHLSEVRVIATIDLKAEEQGLLEFCHKHHIPMRIFKREEVALRNWTTQPSAWVQKTIGIDGVCEPCALMVSHRAKLIVPKTVLDGVAIAVADDSLQVEQ